MVSTTDPQISMRACGLLREARNVTYRWIGEVRTNLDSMQDDEACDALRSRLCMLAAACFTTFDVCSGHAPTTPASEEDFSMAMQCAVIVHDNTPSSLSDDNSVYLKRILSRHRRLLYNLEPIFSESFQSVGGPATLLHSGAYNDALSRLWPGYRQGNSPTWHALPRPNSRWISCVTKEGQDVYYDLLTGKLLICGKQLGRLPQEIVSHPTYASVFGTVSGDSHQHPHARIRILP
jgi:hypothetical protein